MFNKLISLLIIISLYSNTCIADDCAQPVLYLSKGTPSDCDGYRFSLTKESQVRTDEQSYKLLQQESILQTKEIDDLKQELANTQSTLKLSEQESSLWETKAEDSTQKLMAVDSDKTKTEIFLFALGVLTAIGSALAFHAAAK